MWLVAIVLDNAALVKWPRLEINLEEKQPLGYISKDFTVSTFRFGFVCNICYTTFCFKYGFYRVCHRLRLTNRDDFLGLILTTFEMTSFFGGSWGSIGNRLEPKTEPPSGN